MKILLFDNYDSFTYNLLHILKEFGADTEVFRNDRITLDEVARFDKIILSPGPGIPQEAGILLPLIERYAAEKSILGVCLGEQAIGQAFGGTLENLENVYHGVQTPIRLLAADYIFDGLESEMQVGRYHSWVRTTRHAAGLSRSDGRRRRRTDHGIAPHTLRRARRAVSPRIGAYAAGAVRSSKISFVINHLI